MEPEPRAEAQDQQDVTDETTAPTAEEAVTGEVTDVPAAPAANQDEAAESAQAAEIAELKQALGERTNDLKRLQAEYVNYKRRVDRDRDVARNAGIEAVIVDLGGVLDTIRIAQQHEEMAGGFKLLVDELEKITTKYGLEIFGEKGEVFDPQVHDALMQAPMPGVTEPTVLDVMQVGYRFRGRVLRAARVAVGMPTDDAPESATDGTDEGAPTE
ncbi:nucleotide exchange factor GrpE [Granulicoccus sp. GXG6511]|uniref:nucleotide exchange factor GrpE n=1 Tax=Granulicoccus sp. GXG6511 TaxID=3381351 RepID=UPI003D7DC884